MRTRLAAMSLMSLLCAGSLAPSLNVGYWPVASGERTAGDARPRHVEVRPFVDRRPDTEGIGVLLGGFAVRLGVYRTDRPVPEIVRAAVAEARANGHATDGQPDVVLSGEITRFWFDQNWIMSWGPPFPIPVAFDLSADVVFTVSATDAVTGSLLTTRTDRGHYLERTTDRPNSLVKRITAEALARAMNEFATDPEMRDVLERAGKP